jgi:site-specific DNA recombinase
MTSTATTDIVAYTRVSTESQKDRNTIKVQRAGIAEWMARHPEYHLTEEFSDEGVSGTVPFEERPEGARLFASGCKRVVIYCADRLGRKQLDALLAVKEFKRRKIVVEFVSQSFDNTPEGRFTFQVFMAVAELDHAMITRRMHGGIRTLVKDKKLYKTGSAPFGYAYSKEDKQLTVDDERAGTVRRIFKLYIEDGLGIYRIATLLTEEGVPSPGTVSTKVYSNKLAGSWQPSAVRSILRSPTYKGEAVYGSGRKARKRHEELRESGEENVPEEIPMPCPAIISAGTWAKAQRLLATRSAKGSTAKRAYLAQGVMFCGICGYRMTAYTSDHGIAKYRCNRRAAYGTRVPAVRQQHEGYVWDLHAEPLEERIKTEVRRTMADPARLTAHIEARVETVAAEYEERLGAANSVQRQLDDIRAQESRVLDLAQKGLADDEQVRDRLDALAKHKKRLAREAKTVERSVEDIRDIEAQIEFFAMTLTDLIPDEALDVERDDDDRPAWREPQTDADWSRVARALFDRIDVRAPIGETPTITYSGTVAPLTLGGSN